MILGLTGRAVEYMNFFSSPIVRGTGTARDAFSFHQSEECLVFTRDATNSFHRCILDTTNQQQPAHEQYWVAPPLSDVLYDRPSRCLRVCNMGLPCSKQAEKQAEQQKRRNKKDRARYQKRRRARTSSPPAAKRRRSRSSFVTTSTSRQSPRSLSAPQSPGVQRSPSLSLGVYFRSPSPRSPPSPRAPLARAEG